MGQELVVHSISSYLVVSQAGGLQRICDIPPKERDIRQGRVLLVGNLLQVSNGRRQYLACSSELAHSLDYKFRPIYINYIFAFMPNVKCSGILDDPFGSLAQAVPPRPSVSVADKHFLQR